MAQDVGPAHLSLEAVAERAGVSKGGLLYHFPSKQALIIAVVERHLDDLDAACRLAEGEITAATCPVALGYVEAFRRMCRDKSDVPPGILPALAETPAMLDPFRERNRRFADRIRTDRPGWELAMIAFYMIEGMQALTVFDADPLDEGQRERVIDAMKNLLVG